MSHAWVPYTGNGGQIGDLGGKCTCENSGGTVCSPKGEACCSSEQVCCDGECMSEEECSCAGKWCDDCTE